MSNVARTFSARAMGPQDIVRFTLDDREYKGEVLAITKKTGRVYVDIHNGDTRSSVSLAADHPVIIYTS